MGQSSLQRLKPPLLVNKETMSDPVQIANDRFAQGLNCAQAVLAAFAEQAGISEEAALRLASPFGGGIARQGQACGALTGALMVLGLQRGNSSPQGKDETYRLSEEFVRAFQERHSAILCRELIGFDVSTPEGLQAAREGKVFDSVCPGLVNGAAELLAEFLKK
jgi:C_GCAxxG_C_C family probable redox protein